jgi:nicotinamide N-methyltransferase
VIDNIRRNVAANIPKDSSHLCRVEGHAWGVLDTPFATENKHRFDRILAADCYWLSGQHENLITSMLHFLSPDPSARIFVLAGFHTGRARLASFFELAEEQGLVPDEVYEEDDQGNRREWLPERNNGYEDHTERKKWLVIAKMQRKGT